MTFKAALALLAVALQTAQAQQPRPTLRSGVELVMVDVQVLRRDGQPLHGLAAEAFEVWIDGKRRPVATLSMVQHGTSTSAAEAPGAQSAAAMPVSTDQPRTIIIGVDQASLQVVNEPAAAEAVQRLLTMVTPEDEVGLVGYPTPGVRVAPTRDRQAIRDALTKINGQLQVPRPRINVSLAEAVDITAGDAATLREVRERECARLGHDCHSNTLQQVARDVALAFEIQAMRSIAGLRSLVEAVKEYPGRKTLVLVSAGFSSSDRIGGRPDIAFEADTLGKRAAEANAAIYSLFLDQHFLTAYSAANAGRGIQTAFRNGAILERGLDRFTGSAGGALIPVAASPDRAIRRLLRETSAYYVLGVESLAAERDGQVHRIQVKVNQRGAQVRSRTSVFIPKAQ